MNSTRYQHVKAVFEAVADADAGRRADVLDRACRGDDELRADVLSLLDHAERPVVDLDLEASRVGRLLAGVLDPPVPERIGRYTVLRRLGAGGMGVVYLARQERPQRPVALKLMRSALASDGMVRRFEHESEILGRLEHPGIARIHEAGTTDEGHPYYAMEYVDGRPLVEYADRQRLDTRQRLALVAEVCEAVQSAHRRGVIHRDLKPSNILVGADGRPKILDFGIARSTDPDIRRTTTGTDLGRLMGTLPYMSPEQVSGRPADLDTRTDVYSLGVVCYELLAGRLPHDLAGRSVPEAARIICDEPPAPLTGCDRSYRGDVDTMVARALERDRDRRYQSAAELAADIHRYLRGEPIAARRDSIVYVMRKRLRRYRWAAAAAVVAALIVTALAGYGYLQAERSRRLADRERAATRQAEAMSAFLSQMVGLADPDATRTADPTILRLMDEYSPEIGTWFAGEPEAEARIHRYFGYTYFVHGRPDRAAFHLRRALALRDADAPGTPEQRYEILWPLLHVLIDLDDSWPVAPRRELMRLGREIIGRSAPELGAALTALRAYDYTEHDRPEVQAAYRRVLDVAAGQLAEDDPARLYFGDQLYLYGYEYGVWGVPEVACRYLGDALDIQRRILPETDIRVERTLGALVDNALAAGRHGEAEARAREALALVDTVLPADHWYRGVYETRLGASLIPLGRFEESEALLLEAGHRVTGARGVSSGVSVGVQRRLIELYEAWGKPDAAAAHRRTFAEGLAGMETYPASMDIVRIAFGPEHDEIYQALARFRAEVNAARDGVADALAGVREALARNVADNDVLAAVAADLYTMWGRRYFNRGGRAELALPIFDEAVRLTRAGPWRHSRKTAMSLWWLAFMNHALGADAAAEGYARECLAVLERGPTEHYGLVPETRNLLGACLSAQGRFAEAEPLLSRGYEAVLATIGPAHPNTSGTLSRLLDHYDRRGRRAESARCLETHLRRLLDQGTSADALDRWSRRAVRRADGGPRLHGVALTAAARAVELAPDRGAYKLTTAAALYRVGRYADALATFERAGATGDADDPPTAAFIAMTRFRLGDTESAGAIVQRLDGDDDDPIVREARALVGRP